MMEDLPQLEKLLEDILCTSPSLFEIVQGCDRRSKLPLPHRRGP